MSGTPSCDVCGHDMIVKRCLDATAYGTDAFEWECCYALCIEMRRLKRRVKELSRAVKKLESSE